MAATTTAAAAAETPSAALLNTAVTLQKVARVATIVGAVADLFSRPEERRAVVWAGAKAVWRGAKAVWRGSVAGWRWAVAGWRRAVAWWQEGVAWWLWMVGLMMEWREPVPEPTLLGHEEEEDLVEVGERVGSWRRRRRRRRMKKKGELLCFFEGGYCILACEAELVRGGSTILGSIWDDRLAPSRGVLGEYPLWGNEDQSTDRMGEYGSL